MITKKSLSKINALAALPLLTAWTSILFVSRVTQVQALAGGITNDAIGTLGNDPLAAGTGNTFVTYFIYLWNALMVVGGLIVLFFFIQASIEWISAGGDSAKIQKARDRMIQSTIGLFILVMSFVIVNFVSYLLFGDNFNILILSLPSAQQQY